MADFSDAAVQAIQDSVETDVILVGGREYVTREVFLPPKELTPHPLKINTLQGLVDYLTCDFDEVRHLTLIHVASPTQVFLHGRIQGRNNQRSTFVECCHIPHMGDFRFGHFYPIEKFTISIQCLFDDGADEDKVLATVGNISSEIVQTSSDDGVTQTVQVREGVRRVAGLEIVNPVILAPKRSFNEITQPITPFILRVEKGRSGELPTVGLFECDGGEWQLEAIDRIKSWLTASLSDVENAPPVIG